MSRPDRASIRAADIADWLALLLTGVVFILPPDTYPETRVPVLIGIGLAWGLGRRRPVPGGSLLALFLLWAAASLSWCSSVQQGVASLVDLVLAAGLFATAARARSSHLGVVASGVAIVHGVTSALQRWVTLPLLAERLRASPGEFSAELIQRAAGGRAFSTFALPGHLGALLAALAPILIQEAVCANSRFRRRLALAGLAGVATGLYASAALGGLAALVVVACGYGAFAWIRARQAGGGLVAAARPQRWMILASALSVALVVAVVALRLPDLTDLRSSENPVATRLVLWGRSFAVARAAPVTGVGLGSHGIAWTPFLRPTDVPTRHAHMSYLELTGELGLVGLGLICLFAADVLRTPRDTGTALAAAVLLIHAGVDFDLQAAGLLACGFTLLGHAGREAITLERPPAAWLTAVVIGLLALTSLALLHPDGLPRRQPLVSVPAGSDSGPVAGAPSPIDARGHADRAHVLLQSNRLPEALASCREARRLEPEVAAHAGLEGSIRLRRGEFVEALFAYDDAAHFRPGGPAYAATRDALVARLAEAYRPHPDAR